MLANACFVNSGQENPFYSKDMIQLKNSSYKTYGINDEKLFLKSKEAKLNLQQQEIYLLGDVIGQFSFDEENFRIKTENLTGNLLNNTFFSKERVIFETSDIKITSFGMQILQNKTEGVKIIFSNANFNKINSKSKLHEGKANKIELFPSKDLIFMQGEAEFLENNMKIISEEIYYDLSEERITKSVKAKIINL